MHISAVAHADVKHAIGAEGNLASLVIGKRLIDGENDPLRGNVNDRRFGIGLVFGDECLQIWRVCRVVGVEQAILGKVGVKSDGEQAVFVFDVNFFGEVEEWLAGELAVLEEADAADLLDNQLAAIGVRQELDGAVEAAEDGLEFYFWGVGEGRDS